MIERVYLLKLWDRSGRPHEISLSEMQWRDVQQIAFFSDRDSMRKMPCYMSGQAQLEVSEQQ